VFNRLADDFPAPLRDHCLRQLVALTTPPSRRPLALPGEARPPANAAPNVMPALARLPVMGSRRAAHAGGVLLVALAFAGCASGRATSQTSGVVTGTVLSGPRCPGPEIADSPCPPEPVGGATVVALSRGHLIGSTRTDVRGGFRLTLPVDDYSIQATNFGGYRSTATRAVTVTESRPVNVTLLLDTGIR
jgi:hypothetical protein